ncbi:MAG TPA: hypothetical protein ENN99_12245 [Chloroflexi bacterium]|nr:hypothetical protein [Chloroflexota bacterium]
MAPPRCFLIYVICLLCCLAACTSQPIAVTREPVTLSLVVADSCAPLVERLVTAYAEARPWVTIQVQVFDTSVAERMLRAGEVDVALLSWTWEMTYEEPLWAATFAHDGIAVIAHPGVTFSETGLAHLQDVFRGRIQEWGGVVLVVVTRESGSGTRAAFERAVLGFHRTTHNAVVMPSGEAVVEYVARTPGAIGYVSTLHLSDSAVSRVRVLPVEGVLPTGEAITNGEYPISRPLRVATVTEPTGEAREFAQWLLNLPERVFGGVGTE